MALFERTDTELDLEVLIDLDASASEEAIVRLVSLEACVWVNPVADRGFHAHEAVVATLLPLEANAGGGAMTAMIGFDRAQLDDLVAATDGVSIANDNSDAQVVISGSPEAVERVSGAVKCKRAIPLAVSGAFHSPFMAQAAERFAAELDNVPFLDARVPVLSNSAASASTSADELKQRLKQQMTTGVRWRVTLAAMTDNGVDTLVEIGPGNVLSGLAKRSMSGVTTAQILSLIHI